MTVEVREADDDTGREVAMALGILAGLNELGVTSPTLAVELLVLAVRVLHRRAPAEFKVRVEEYLEFAAAELRKRDA